MVLTFKASFQPGIAWLIMHNQHHYAKFKDFYQILDIKLVQKSKKLKKSRSQRRKDVKEVKKSKKLRSSEVEQVEDVTVLHFSGAIYPELTMPVRAGCDQKLWYFPPKDFLDFWHGPSPPCNSWSCPLNLSTPIISCIFYLWLNLSYFVMRCLNLSLD